MWLLFKCIFFGRIKILVLYSFLSVIEVYCIICVVVVLLCIMLYLLYYDQLVIFISFFNCLIV